MWVFKCVVNVWMCLSQKCFSFLSFYFFWFSSSFLTETIFIFFFFSSLIWFDHFITLSQSYWSCVCVCVYIWWALYLQLEEKDKEKKMRIKHGMKNKWWDNFEPKLIQNEEFSTEFKNMWKFHSKSWCSLRNCFRYISHWVSGYAWHSLDNRLQEHVIPFDDIKNSRTF